MSAEAVALVFPDSFATGLGGKVGSSSMLGQIAGDVFVAPSVDAQQIDNFFDPESSVLVFPSVFHNNTQFSRASVVQTSFVAEQEWEGYVTQVMGDEFLAHLIDLSAADIEEEAVFSIVDVSSIHKELVKEGAIFRWSIGYERVRGGTKRKVSSIVFRRLPAWSKKDISKSLSEVESFQANIIWE